MAIVVIGGHSRNVGKTSVVAGLIAKLPAYNWTAFKVTQFGHGRCSLNGRPCQCETADHAWASRKKKIHQGKLTVRVFFWPARNILSGCALHKASWKRRCRESSAD